MQLNACEPGVQSSPQERRPDELSRKGAGPVSRGELESPREAMVEISVNGKTVTVPGIELDGVTAISTGRWLKMATIKDEEYLDGEVVTDPEALVGKLKRSRLRPDIFTFAQKLPNVTPRYRYHTEWENVAAIPITSYSDWLENRVTYDVRKAVKRAQRLGVEIGKATFDDAFVQGVCNIYNECPVRQGKAFWHYKKDAETVKKEHSTFRDRCCFIGAYVQGELVGFIRMVYVGTYAASVQVLSQIKYRREKTTNALIAKAVEICEQEGLSHFVYGRYVYNNPASSLTEFKRRNGFEQILLPRYYIPITLKGAIALKLRLHRSLPDYIPMSCRPLLHRIRERVRVKSQDASEDNQAAG